MTRLLFAAAPPYLRRLRRFVSPPSPLGARRFDVALKLPALLPRFSSFFLANRGRGWCSAGNCPAATGATSGEERGKEMTESGRARTLPYRWLQLTAGIVCMILIANLQYGWTLFVQPMAQAHGWDVAEYSVRVQPLRRPRDLAHAVDGWIVDALGPTARPEADDRVSAACWSAPAGSSIRSPIP